MDSRVESRRGIWRGVGGGSRTGLDPGGGFRGSAGRTSSRLRISSGSSSSSPSPRDRSSPSPPPPPPDPASSPPSGGHHRPPRTSRARPPRPPARRRWTRARIPRAPRTTRVVRWTRNATRTSRRDARARGSPRAIARSPPSRCCLLSNEIVPRRTRHRATRSRRAERVAPHTRERGHQRASRRECRGRHRRRRRDSPLRARWGVVGPGR